MVADGVFLSPFLISFQDRFIFFLPPCLSSPHISFSQNSTKHSIPPPRCPESGSRGDSRRKGNYKRPILCRINSIFRLISSLLPVHHREGEREEGRGKAFSGERYRVCWSGADKDVYAFSHGPLGGRESRDRIEFVFPLGLECWWFTGLVTQ